MKKTIILLSAAAIVFAACQKEEGSIASINGLKLTATIEQQDSGLVTKTYLDDLQVKWSAGDKVNVFTNAETPEKLTLTLSEGDSTTSGTFTTSESYTGTPQYAIYPAASGNSIKGDSITFTLPATQDYVENSFDNGANVAVGKVYNGNIAYKNACGVFKLSLCGNFKVSKIVLKTKGTEKLCGTFTVNAASVGDGATYSTGTVDSLTLNCVTSKYTNGVQLKPTDFTTFYFVVPAGAFASGFTAKVYEKDNATSYTYTELSTTADNSISRSRVKAMPESTILPPAYQKVEYIESSGTQYINAGILPSVAKFECICIFTYAILNQGIFGYNYSDSGTQRRECFTLNESVGKISFGYGDGTDAYWQPQIGELDAKYIFYADFVNKTASVTKEGTEIASKTFSGESRTNAIDFYVMATNNNNTLPITSSSQCFGFKVWDNKDALIRNFIPCYDKSQGKTTGGCMYDAVNGVLYQNAGSGNFNCGDEIYH